ncbi:hypothetical protein KR009_008645 [Drosophila setifemur]|nr:hypothetical protein KR009_008645 [Drosophila setifemur]
MFDWLGWLLKSLYNYGQLIGVSNFEVDWSTGRAYTTRRSTLFAITLNVLLVTFLIFYFNGEVDLYLGFSSANQLHEHVIIILTGLRIVEGLTTLLNRWRLRNHIMQLVRYIVGLCLAKPQMKRMIRWGVLLKLVIASIPNGIQVLVTIKEYDCLNPRQILGSLLQLVIAAILCFDRSEHYLVMLCLKARYHLLYLELREVIEESHELSHHSPRNGVFMTRCCYLADHLDKIARIQNELQSVMTGMTKLFGMQALFVSGGYYISFVATNYMTYSLLKYSHEKLGITLSTTVMFVFFFAFYYIDGGLNYTIMLLFQDEHQNILRILEERTLFAPGLDTRLEESFENFQIQLIRNPLKLRILNLFYVDRSSTSSMLGSLVVHCIYLIQYDMENF